MTYEELVARLTAAVDSTDPVVDGNANEADEQQAEIILARLVAAHDHPGGSVVQVSDRSAYAARLTRWEDNIDQGYVEFDRAIRALMTMIQERAVRYPDAETDARGNPIPEELRGEIYDSEIRGWDPETPFPAAATGVSASGIMGCIVRHARDVGIDGAVCESALACGRAYESARNAPVPVLRHYGAGSVGGNDYAAALAAATAFCEYLDALE